jgi:hypothetical protein
MKANKNQSDQSIEDALLLEMTSRMIEENKEEREKDEDDLGILMEAGEAEAAYFLERNSGDKRTKKKKVRKFKD